MSRHTNRCCACTKKVSSEVVTCGSNATANLYFCPGYGVGPNLCDCNCPPDCIAVDPDREGECCRCPHGTAGSHHHRPCHRPRGEEDASDEDTDQGRRRRRRRRRRRCCCSPCSSNVISDNYFGRCYDEEN